MKGDWLILVLSLKYPKIFWKDSNRLWGMGNECKKLPAHFS